MFTININYIKMKTIENNIAIETLVETIKIIPEKKRINQDDQNIKRILVPVDFSETSDFATYKAASLANLLDAELFLIHVLDYNDVQYSIDAAVSDSRLPIGQIELEVYRKLNEIRLLIEDQVGIKCRMFAPEGDIDVEIIKFAKNKMIDLIVMGTHGVSGYKEILLGSNAQRVVMHSDVPVLTMKKEHLNDEFKNILLPIDDSPHSREKVNIAAEIAEIYGSQIYLLGLPDSKEESDLKTISIKLESVEKILDNCKIPYETHVIDDEKYLAQAALDYSTIYNCDLIVINTGHESKVNGSYLGPFAQQIVNHSKIPVLSVKPTEDSYIISAPGFGIS
jgi:nucleotide-binding universal stress UspA family protein